MQALINNLQIITDPITGTTSTVNLKVTSKVTITGNNTPDIIYSEIYNADTNEDLSDKFSYYKDLIVQEPPSYTAAKNAYLNEVKNLYEFFLQSKGINISNVTVTI